MLPKLTAHAYLIASSRPDAILFLPSTVCSSRVTTRNPNFQQLAKDKKLNPNQWEVHLIEFKFCEDTRPDPQLQKAKAQQHSMLIANLNRQGYQFQFGGVTATAPSRDLTDNQKKEEGGLKQRRKQKEAAQGDPEPKKGNQEKEKTQGKSSFT